MEPPAIPYLGILQSDLLFLDAGNPNFLGDSGTLVNFEKHAKESRVLRWIQKYQSISCVPPSRLPLSSSFLSFLTLAGINY
jgi:hypothetical protein